MAVEEKFASIADASKANAGRIYDFILGGNHNFEVDRVAAKQVIQLAPIAPKLFRLVRWFLGAAVRKLVSEGQTNFIDFASGLPTVDHIHQVASADTKVIYSDIDPVTVAYGQEIIKDLPNIRYVVCPAENPEYLLSSPAVASLFGDDRKVAIGFNGVAYFISDEHLAHAMKTLYDWAEPGSRLFLCDVGFEGAAPNRKFEQAGKMYEMLGQPIYVRSKAKLVDICRPWAAVEPGFRPLEEWMGLKAGVAEATQSQGYNVVGAILAK